MDTLYIIDCETGLPTEEGKGRSFLTGRLTGGLAKISSGDSRVDDSIVRLDGNSSLNRKRDKGQVTTAKHHDDVTSSTPQDGMYSRTSKSTRHQTLQGLGGYLSKKKVEER
jgi:hypothetical protein